MPADYRLVFKSDSSPPFAEYVEVELPSGESLVIGSRCQKYAAVQQLGRERVAFFCRRTLPSCTCTASVGQNRACASFSPPPTPQLVNNTLTYTSFDNGSEKIVAEVTGTLPLHGLGLSVGQYAELRRTFTATDLTTFGRLTGDYNPIHYEEEDEMHRPTYNEVDPVSEIVTEVATAEKIGGGDAAANTMPRIVHGILVASLFPSLILPSSPPQSTATRSLSSCCRCSWAQRFLLGAT